VTEGDDKPLKYPSIFFKSDLFLLTKIDLLPYVPFDAEMAEANARMVHPGMEIVRASSTAEHGLDAWLAWLKQRMAQARQEALVPAAI
jgi:hydrogenase nickel incorporation protein HypB